MVTGKEVLGVTFPEIPDDGELALSLEQARGVGRVTGLVACHRKSSEK